eukprot:CAMPEP_0119341356 /NCGR_PEP_ID=MMETSP1333-20130426/102160_1 /TAXON_ID=418940 /ORGANISM="Scyphosphaera apsteinii, Strain RCC1455" /LENGTH=319 /DNA_ID=CAMNT_0007353297 /DNA_START=196 /DNA_END=1155 /DNA_ORIENTATION=-
MSFATERSWLLANAMCQMGLFLPFVILPSLVTGQMYYVDFGWPSGLVLLGAQGLLHGEGFWLRRWLMGGAVLLHGTRMAFGAFVLFWPFWRADDLPRYRYAKLRFVEMEGQPGQLWPFKMLHDLLQQACANMVILACPVVLSCFDVYPQLGGLEAAGFIIWFAAWLFESAADSQKLYFSRQTRLLPPKEAATAVIGHPPFDGPAYRLWTLCRHPNYFCEWLAWSGLALAAIPSALRHDMGGGGLVATAGVLAMLYCVPRFLYDCLNYWTGAEPAEFFSTRKRAAYADYQKAVRVFWPFELPFVDHGRRAGWPRMLKESD